VRAVVQRVTRASVIVSGEQVASIGRGLVVLVAVTHGDGTSDADWMASKVANLRVFHDDDGRMNRSLVDVAGEAIVVSQFTLYGDARRGRRPSFVEAAAPEAAEPLVAAVAARLRELGLTVGDGRFGAHMDVELVNDGPVTILLDSPRA
jgi:D-tyrosyl-tRNA(Tyr) deacylase